jgi:pyruvate/2-oxoglutarate dehydrogenase complex dihydrolipoamide acyltransferase (E2) component
MEKGVLCAWLKEPGEHFKKGEPLFEIETSKVVNQVEASEDGIMGEQLVEEGDEVAVGTELAKVE